MIQSLQTALSRPLPPAIHVCLPRERGVIAAPVAVPVQPAAVSSVGVDPVAAGGADPGALDAELPEEQVGLGRRNVPPCLAGLAPDLDGVAAAGSVPGSPRVFCRSGGCPWCRS